MVEEVCLYNEQALGLHFHIGPTQYYYQFGPTIFLS